MTKKEKVSTQECPRCGNEKLVLIRTQNVKMCTDCNVDGHSLEIPWYLEDGQVTLK